MLQMEEEPIVYILYNIELAGLRGIYVTCLQSQFLPVNIIRGGSREGPLTGLQFFISNGIFLQ